MRGDVTRQTFRSRKHYRSVLQQQGRVLLDAEWNEQADIQAYLDRTLTADVVGRSGAPLTSAGMEIVNAAGTMPADVADDELWISAGHYYVDGILCENDAPVRLAAQPDLPGVALPAGEVTYIVYLDVWFEHVTALEQPALREVALGGPDTATRARTMWQVRLRPDDEDPPAGAKDRKAQMRAQAVAPASDEPVPCVIGPAAAYRRLENQLYRVEVFDPGDKSGAPTFLWSRENGSVVAALTDSTPSLLTIAAPGRDDRLAFRTGNWVEVTDRARTRRGEHGLLAKLGVVNGPLLAVAEWYGATPGASDLAALTDSPVVRRWDGDAGPQPLFADPTLIPLEGGIHVEFAPEATYRTGDYWLIPARTANVQDDPVVADLAGNIEWPRDDKDNGLLQPPAGVIHHYADIARLTRKNSRWTRTADERPVFGSLTELAASVDVDPAGGDGQETLPGEPLDQPLAVSVTRNQRPLKGLKVRFTADAGNGVLAADRAGLGTPDASTVDVDTDDDGLARCFWQPDRQRPSQVVTARLVVPVGVPPGPVVGFSASLSLADRVAFDPRTCAPMAGTKTVQEALLRLAGAPVLVPFGVNGGNGQIAVADAILPTPVEVLATSCGEPVAGIKVRFAITEGGVAEVGGTPSAPSVDLLTDDAGVARCVWQLGRDVPLQTLTATLLDDTDPDPRAVPLTFVAGVVPSALTVARFELPQGTALTDGATVAVTDLAGGPTVVVLDGVPEPVVADGPALGVTLDLPFPFSQSDRDLWPAAVSGTLPLRLDGTAAVTTVGGAPAVGWSPSDGTRAFLDVLLATMRDTARGDRVRGHVRLAGRVLGPAAMDVSRWFWLGERLTDLVVVLHRDGRLKVPSAQRAIAMSLQRDTLRAGLPAGVTVADVARDPDGAKAAARRIFNATAPARPLILVVDARYTAAGIAVRDALATVGIELQPVDAADPVREVTTRLGNHEIVDGVLTDGASAATVEAVTGFTGAVPL